MRLLGTKFEQRINSWDIHIMSQIMPRTQITTVPVVKFSAPPKKPSPPVPPHTSTAVPQLTETNFQVKSKAIVKPILPAKV